MAPIHLVTDNKTLWGSSLREALILFGSTFFCAENLPLIILRILGDSFTLQDSTQILIQNLLLNIALYSVPTSKL